MCVRTRSFCMQCLPFSWNIAFQSNRITFQIHTYTNAGIVYANSDGLSAFTVRFSAPPRWNSQYPFGYDLQIRWLLPQIEIDQKSNVHTRSIAAAAFSRIYLNAKVRRREFRRVVVPVFAPLPVSSLINENKRMVAIRSCLLLFLVKILEINAKIAPSPEKASL